jgi:2,3-bisphosphoglycerate-dependent phosphoglycerate mutase
MSPTIYLLRHEQRGKDVTFTSRLTEQGCIRSSALVSTLQQLSITSIYSSPFVRTLQTIRPYAEINSVLVNIEWGLAESLSASIPSDEFFSIINKQYNSYFSAPRSSTNLSWPVLQRRVSMFLDMLDKTHVSSDVILLVCHLPVINAFIEVENARRKLPQLQTITMYTHRSCGSLIKL